MTDPLAAAAGAMERYCDERGIPMPSPGLARALAEVAAPHLAQHGDPLPHTHDSDRSADTCPVCFPEPFADPKEPAVTAK